MRNRFLFIVVALALLAAACGSDDSSQDSAGEAEEAVSSIRLVAAQYSDATAPFWEQFAETYEERYGTALEVQVVGWTDIKQQATTMIQSGLPPDILNINFYSSYASEGLLYSADEVLPDSVEADLIDSFKTSGTFDGVLYGFPDLSSARALFYNKDLFSQAGIAGPPTTWDEFVEAAKLVDALGDNIIGYGMPLGPEEAQAEFSIWTYNNGGDWKDADGNWTINSATNIETLEFLKKLSVEDGVTQNNPATTNRTDAFDLFGSGIMGMVVGFSPLSATLDEVGEVDYGIAPMPTNAGAEPQTYGVTDYLNAFKNPGNQQAVKNFYELYYSPEQVNTFIKAEGFLPVTISGLDVFSSEPSLQVYIDTLPNIHLTPNQDPVWDTVLLAVQQNIGAAINGDPATVLGQLQETALAEAGG